MHESYHVYYFNCVTRDETARSGTAPRKSVQFRKMELQEFRGTRERAPLQTRRRQYDTIRVSQHASV